MACGCGSNGGTTILYACSGAANTGLLADRVVRNLRDAGTGKMTCLAAIGAELPGYLETAKSADRNVIIDGCPVACGKKIFDRLGLHYEDHVLTEHGVEKGKTAITDEVVDSMTEKMTAVLSACGGTNETAERGAAAEGCGSCG